MLQVYLVVLLLFCKLCACTEMIEVEEVIPLCENNDPHQVNASCNPSGSCNSENSEIEGIKSCFQSSNVHHLDAHQYEEYYGPGVTSCLQHDSFYNDYYTSCEPVTDEGDSVSPFGLPNSVAVSLSSVDVRHFNMSLTWEHRDAEYASNLRGYQIILHKINKADSERHEVLDCFCVNDASRRNLGVPFFRYDPMDDYELDVSVSTFPRHIEHPSPQYTSRATHKWPQNCLSVSHTFETCSVPRYGPPSNLTVSTSLHSTSLESTPALMAAVVTWDPPSATSDMYVLPTTYYITIFSENFFHTFVAVGTHSVEIAPLNALESYTLSVRAYAPCTGLQLLTENTVSMEQCGHTTRTQLDLAHTTQPPFTTIAATTIAATTIPTSTDPEPQHPHTIAPPSSTVGPSGLSTPDDDTRQHLTSVMLVFIVAAFIVLVLLVTVVINVTVVILFYRHSTLRKDSMPAVDPSFKYSSPPITSTV